MIGEVERAGRTWPVITTMVTKDPSGVEWAVDVMTCPECGSTVIGPELDRHAGWHDGQRVVQRYYRVLLPDGRLWCETRDPAEALRLSENVTGARLETCVTTQQDGRWIYWDGTVQP